MNAIRRIGYKTIQTFNIGIKAPKWGTDINDIDRILKYHTYITEKHGRTMLRLPMSRVTLTLTFPNSFKYNINNRIIEIFDPQEISDSNYVYPSKRINKTRRSLEKFDVDDEDDTVALINDAFK